MKGIVNIGNSCYMNSALQLLFNNKDFTKMVNQSQHTVIQTINSNIIKYNTHHLYNPSEFKQIVKSDQFSGYSQEDSSEFILKLFDIMDKFIHIDLYKNFGIETNINIKCKLANCLHETSREQTELCLHLHIHSTLDESYREYKSIEVITNDYVCDNCKNNTIVRKKTVITTWAPNLLIVLRRFDNMMRKNNNKIDIPLLWRHSYVLQGGIIHNGHLNGGHYIYFGLENDNWFIANDYHVVPITDINIFLRNYAANFYVLSYKKKI